MSGKWAWDGPPDNIHVFQADDPNMRICFLTSNGPTEERANIIAAAPEMLEALKAVIDANTDFRKGMPENWEGDPLQDACDEARAVIAKVEGRS